MAIATIIIENNNINNNKKNMRGYKKLELYDL